MATIILDPELERDLRDQRAAWGGDRFDEVWEGIYIMSPLADNEHQEIASQLCAAIRAAVGWGNPIKILPGANVSDREDGWEFNYRCPDVLAFVPNTKAKNCGTHWCGGPDFAVEITSPHDRSREKLEFYGKVGVLELLLVDRAKWQLEFYSLAGNQLKLDGSSTVKGSDPSESKILGVTFRLVPPKGDQDRPAIEVRHRASGQTWLI
jgi:Uma2 family endonuclease